MPHCCTVPRSEQVALINRRIAREERSRLDTVTLEQPEFKARTRSLRSPLAMAVLTLTVVLPALAAGPVLHEYFIPSTGEDLELGAVAPGGQIPAAIPGADPNRPIQAPDVNRDPYSSRVTYGGATDAASDRSGYKIDRATSRPDSVSYHEPFIPSIAPFKRLSAYDSLDENLELVVGDTTLRPIEVGGMPADGEDQFYGDLAVELVPGTPVRIPSVGPGARVLAVNVSPSVPYTLLRDSADNWFVQSNTRQRVRLTLQLAIERAVFGGGFSAAASYDTLRPALPRFPRSAKQAAARVVEHIGVLPTTPPAEALARLVQYFRSFQPSLQYPEAALGAPLYEELSMTRKGVCRHRAYAFVVTALAKGIPSRMVMNEAHAWVEVFDGTRWYRVDLGGAADRMIFDRESRFEPYRQPKDPFAWPERSESGESMVGRALGSGTVGGDSGHAEDKSLATPPRVPGAGLPEGVVENAPVRAESHIVAQMAAKRIVRGQAFRITGTFEGKSGPCAQARVDILLQGPTGELIHVQSIPTDSDGRFDHEITIPTHVPVGDYSVHFSSPGTTTCGAATLE